jgi:hypothetical protein
MRRKMHAEIRAERCEANASATENLVLKKQFLAAADTWRTIARRQNGQHPTTPDDKPTP